MIYTSLEGALKNAHFRLERLRSISFASYIIEEACTIKVEASSILYIILI